MAERSKSMRHKNGRAVVVAVVVGMGAEADTAEAVADNDYLTRRTAPQSTQNAFPLFRRSACSPSLQRFGGILAFTNPPHMGHARTGGSGRPWLKLRHPSGF